MGAGAVSAAFAREPSLEVGRGVPDGGRTGGAVLVVEHGHSGCVECVRACGSELCGDQPCSAAGVTSCRYSWKIWWRCDDDGDDDDGDGERKGGG